MSDSCPFTQYHQSACMPAGLEPSLLTIAPVQGTRDKPRSARPGRVTRCPQLMHGGGSEGWRRGGIGADMGGGEERPKSQVRPLSGWSGVGGRLRR